MPEVDVFVQEHLTNATKKLLKDTKEALADKGFAYPGYVKQGEVRVRKVEFGPFQVVTCEEDLTDILSGKRIEKKKGRRNRNIKGRHGRINEQTESAAHTAAVNTDTQSIESDGHGYGS